MTNRSRIVSSAIALTLLVFSYTLPAFATRAAEGTPSPVLGEAPCRMLVRGTPVAGTPEEHSPMASPVVAVPFDLIFLELMIRQRERVGAAGELASAGAQHRDLANTGRAIADDATADIRQLREWRAEWYGDIPPLTDRAMAAALDRLAKDQGLQRGIPGAFEILAMSNLVERLCHAGPRYDLTLLDALIPAISAELLLVRSAKDLAVHPEVREMAQREIERDQPRLDSLIAWKNAWYPATPVAEATPAG